jgi:hypothetical protein
MSSAGPASESVGFSQVREPAADRKSGGPRYVGVMG